MKVVKVERGVIFTVGGQDFVSVDGEHFGPVGRWGKYHKDVNLRRCGEVWYVNKELTVRGETVVLEWGH